ncbi:MAG TPA: Nif3-like dinuclear metal center hexameric protein [Armatimonadota bacterium]|nr:Nif3-like dinuclear metal center hexameric protein [Armatimonadota bacterium]
MLLEELIRVCNRLAPEALAEEWDNVGLQAGDPGREVRALLLCLETTADTVAEARRLGVDCIVSHHPLLFRPLRSLREDRAEGRLLADLARAGIALYAMHTNLDNANPGTSDALAAALGIVDLQPLEPLTRPAGEPMLKLAVFVPVTHAEALRAALGNAGAGHVGNYSHCSFSASGVGAFLPLAGAKPAIGAVGVPERVPEEKVEVLVPRRILPQVLTAMLAVHPYEEVAYDLYPLETPPTGAGFGRIGRWETPGTLAEFAARVRAALEKEAGKE